MSCMTRFGFGQIIEAVRAIVDEQGLTNASRQLNLPMGVVRSANEARNLSTQSVELLADRLGWDIYVGPPRRDGAFQRDGSIDRSGKPVPHLKRPAAPPPLDIDRLTTALRVTLTALEERDLEMPPDKLAQLAAEIYAYLIEGGREDAAIVRRLVSLAS